MADLGTLLEKMRARELASLTEAERTRRAALEDARLAEAEAERAARCPVCDGGRFVRVPRADGNVPDVVPCDCLPLEDRLPLAGIPRRFRTLTLDTFPDVDGKSTALAYCRSWDKRASVVLFGEPGIWGAGKTGLMCALLRELCAEGRPCKFVRVADLLETAKSKFDDDSTETSFGYFERMRTEPVLALDDLGAETGTPWAVQQLATLIDYRYAHQLTTLVTTNLTFPEVREHLGGAVASRLAEWDWVFVGGADLRAGGAR